MIDTTDRHSLEFKSKLMARVIEQTEDYKLVKVLGSFNMYILKGDKSVGPHLESEGYWEPWITLWFLNNIDLDTTFFDIGANTGYYSFVAAKLGADVLSFEPNPIYYKMIKDSARRNGLSGWFFKQAISDDYGKATLSVPEDLHGSASIMVDFSESHNGTSHEVVTAPLDAWLNLHKSKTFVKIDAEGAEEKIWEGSQQFNQHHRPTYMIEWTPRAYSDAFYEKLSAYGKVSFINYEGGLDEVDQSWVESQDDWVMLVVEPWQEN